jgi:MFS family permease
VYLTFLLGYLCLASSLTANIYFPLLGLLAKHYNTSIQAINLTISLYILVQGIAPSIFSPLSDTLGRRPIYLISFTLYTLAFLGLAFSGSSYVALLLLRALQNMGGSATLSLAYAVVADYTVHAERGKFLAPIITATNIGPSIGPVIGGGAILATGEPRLAFWALVGFGGSALSLIAFTMRETNRNVVGNRAVPAKDLWRSWGDVLLARKSGSGKRVKEKEDTDHTGSEEDAGIVQALARNPNVGINTNKTGKGVLKVPNPFVSLRLLFYKDAFTVLCLAALPYASWYTITTSIPLIYCIEYGFNDLVVGCCYLAGGSGILAGGFITGRLMDWNYKVTAKEAGLPIDRVGGDDMRIFPIERARSRGSYLILSVFAFGFIGYGWAVQRRAHPAVALMLQFYLGCKCTVLHQTYSALLIDIFQANPGTAGASNNICRCALSAAAVAALQPCVDAMGRGWFFTMVGLLDGMGSVVMVYVLRRWVPGWRRERMERAEPEGG